MYPIHSLLRRFASTVLYVEVGSKIGASPRIQQLNMKKGVWTKRKGRQVLIYELVAEARTASLAAQKLSLRENEIARTLQAEDQRYTLIFGPGEQVELPDGSVRRVTRIAALNGIFRYQDGIVERLRRKTPSGAVARSKPRPAPPPGALIERR